MSGFSHSTAKEKENIQNSFGCDFNTNSVYPLLHNHTFFEFTFFFARTKHFINGRTVWLEENTLIFLRPKDTHYLSDCREAMGHLNLKISCEQLRSLCDFIDPAFYNLLMESEDFLLSVQTSPEFGRQVRKFLDELLITPDKKPKFVSCKFMICTFLKILYYHLYDPSEQPISDTVKRIMSLLRNSDNFGTNITELLSNLGYSYMQLYRLFKDATGQTPNAFFAEQKLRYAANLLTYTSYKIAEIASLCGFASQPRFDTAFKKHYGVPPREYRCNYSKTFLTINAPK